LDEPDAHADSSALLLLQQAMLALKQRGVTTVLITHQLATLRIADRILVLQDGEVAAFGPREEIQARLAGPRRNIVPMTGSKPQVDEPGRRTLARPATAEFVGSAS
jgi:ABC-type protease/lipase transport system fused ATPase/permease subunit